MDRYLRQFGHHRRLLQEARTRRTRRARAHLDVRLHAHAPDMHVSLVRQKQSACVRNDTSHHVTSRFWGFSKELTPVSTASTPAAVAITEDQIHRVQATSNGSPFLSACSGTVGINTPKTLPASAQSNKQQERARAHTHIHVRTCALTHAHTCRHTHARLEPTHRTRPAHARMNAWCVCTDALCTSMHARTHRPY